MFYIADDKILTPEDQADILDEVLEGVGFYIKDHRQEAIALLGKYSITTDGSDKQLADAYVEKLFEGDKKFYKELISEMVKYDLIDAKIFTDKNKFSVESNIAPEVFTAVGDVIGGIFGIIKTGQEAGMQKKDMKMKLLAMLYGTKESEKQEQRSINTIITVTAVVLIILFILMLFYLTVIKPKKQQ